MQDKKNKILFSCLTIIIIIAIIIVGIFIIQDGKSAQLVSNTEYANLNSINIVAKSSDIYIQRSTNSKVYLEIRSRQKDNFQINNEENNLVVTFTPSLCLIGCRGDEEIILYLPETYQNILTLNTTSGDIDASNLNTNAEIKTTSGDVDIQLALQDYEIQTTTKSGEIDIERPNVKGAPNYLNITTTSGDIDIE